MQEFNNSPQLSGSYGKGQIYVFHRKHNYSNGVKMSDDINNLDNYRLTSAKWSVFSYGKSEITLDLANDKLKLAKAVGSLVLWSEDLLSKQSMADPGVGIKHYSTHYLYSSVSSAYYNNLEPKTNIVGGALPPNEATKTGYDLVALIVQTVTGGDNGTSKLLVWDGTSNGILDPQLIDPACHGSIQESLKYVSHHTAPTYSQESWSILIRALPAGTSPFFGVPLLVEGVNDGLNNTLSRFKPGMWVRLRNIRLNLSSAGPDGRGLKGLINFDTHINQLEPYFR